ncbi:DUF3306 domain-containing protein [Bradyrhizobium diazoefficiens]|uniref:DUF3306 domain-containing protein n=1 Tax=Bradyrhizobium diazoefficiens TaxID=1355477 RepID=A0A810C4F0_9BRAD|nr:DUF3306 domain-containing protein [Bradyrhizobium diazoefficiens]BCA05258.1 hypothetical protein H12S4_61620 [Bradyrhizobium diazoefficiens]BCA22613.1 hypothetical protein BDHH15_58280 [Bradyrhizobium diazoefficiens]BCE31988.1 hypothetical protein XF2B_57570 [Bradyrhizobium diazoefficiens]BCE40773.1 hypothetical protein XF3B_58040 [Bradyrhizobium diazoefficiens]BCE83367.1 hypothetical protein XF9B_47880 [Bradyrhizobium diazoefficiens]
MSEDRFLTRWSRRKQHAKANPTQSDPAKRDDMQSALPPAAKDDEAEFDPSSLPSIDLITSATDIKAFLRKGIPQELTRAALRRAWSADPAIRDFVGLAESAWDFNDPTAMPGFGPLDCSEAELAAFVDRIVGGVSKSVETLSETPVEVTDSSRELRQAERSNVEVVAEEAAPTKPAPVPAAAQLTVPESTESEHLSLPRRPHGGALPR